MSDLWRLTAAELAALVRDRQVSAEEVTQSALDRLGSVNPAINAVIDEFPDEVLIEDLAQTLRDNNYEIQPVLERMILSEHFFDVEFRASIITDGVDRSAGLLRSLYIDNLNLVDLTPLLGGIQEVLPTVFDPFNGPVQLHRSPW